MLSFNIACAVVKYTTTLWLEIALVNIE